ncbi:MAG: uroporphyrinogen-III synthase [Ilumatobacteraceae bacterium]
MSDDLLLGCRVVTTRPEAGALEALLAEHGATVLHIPLTEIVDLPLPTQSEQPIDWLVVTSANGARRSQPWADLAQHRCAVGPITAEALRDSTGRTADLVPENASGEGLVERFPAAPTGGGHVVVVRGEQASDEVRAGIQQLGWTISEIVAYRTQERSVARATATDGANADLVLLAASSAASAWALTCRQYELTSPPVIAIGSPTAAAAENHGLNVVAIADPSSVQGLVDATLKHFCER